MEFIHKVVLGTEKKNLQKNIKRKELQYKDNCYQLLHGVCKSRRTTHLKLICHWQFYLSQCLYPLSS